MRHRQASMKGAMCISRLQMAGITYQPKFYPQKYSTGIIKSGKINLIKLIYEEFYQTPFNQHQIQNLLILKIKIWMTEKLSNSFKIILKCSKWLFRFIKINFRKITDDLNLFKSCGSKFCLMIDLAKEVLEDRINTDYKKVLDLIKKEKPTMAHNLGKKIVENRLNWWTLRSFEIGKDFI
jgi:hypothetical protein